VTPETVNASIAIMLGEGEIPARSAEAAFFAQDATSRSAAYGVYSKAP
jgi:hypothetical protein